MSNIEKAPDYLKDSHYVERICQNTRNTLIDRCIGIDVKTIFKTSTAN